MTVPSTHEVREAFVDRRDFEAQVSRQPRPSDEESGAHFDAWLTQRDRRVAAAALQDLAGVAAPALAGELAHLARLYESGSRDVPKVD